MIIFVVNCGSSSLKYDLIDMEKSATIMNGQFTSIGSDDSKHSYSINDNKQEDTIAFSDHEACMESLNELFQKHKIVENNKPIFESIGHRVVHGAEQFVESVVIDEAVKEAIKDLIPLAPLHNPVNLMGIEICEKFFPGIKQVAVFDTAFHQTLPTKSYLYGVPFEWYENFKIRRYGFHGNSHKYVALKAAEYLKQPLYSLRLITCHLGNGVSVCAINYGESIDTTMGFGPLEGLIMGTRSGDIDATIIHYLMEEQGMNIDQVMKALNKQSGLLGISGETNNMKDIVDMAAHGHERCMLAVKMFVRRLLKVIGSYIALLGDVDAIIFTGGIGENAYQIRERVCQKLEFAGAIMDEDLNILNEKNKEGICDFSASESRVKLLGINTDEEWMIANETQAVIKGKRTVSEHRIPIPIGISARHIHLSREHMDTLFGKDKELTPISDLTQPGQYVCEEKVTLKGPKGTIERVRVLGPLRSKTQIEISKTDEYALGVKTEIRASGDVEDTPGILVEGPHGSIELEEGVIRALRHIHMTPADAQDLQVDNGDLVRVKVDGARELIFGDVLVRVSSKYRLEMHVDTDEANGADLARGSVGYVVGVQSSRDIYD